MFEKGKTITGRVPVCIQKHVAYKNMFKCVAAITELIFNVFPNNRMLKFFVCCCLSLPVMSACLNGVSSAANSFICVGKLSTLSLFLVKFFLDLLLVSILKSCFVHPKPKIAHNVNDNI